MREFPVDGVVDPDGRRPCCAGVDRVQTDPRWRNNLLFFEYFRGDKTGWSGLAFRACPRSSKL
jgi:hypothetical protein